MPPPILALPAPPPPPSALQTNQSNTITNSSNNKLEESGGAKHIDPKLIEMITSEVRKYRCNELFYFKFKIYRLWNLI